MPKGGAADLDWGELRIDFYKERRNWESLWRACISLSIVQTIKKSSIDESYKNKEDISKLEKIRNDREGLKYPLLRRLIYIDEHKTPISYLNHILSTFRQDEIKALLKEQQFMDEVISEIQTPIAIFIDNIDEYFEEHSEKDKQTYNPSIRGIFDIDLWYASQHGLMFAIKNMCRTVHHLDIFATIRKEAYEKLSGTMVENIRGHCLDNIQYSSDKLKEIFENNIKWTDKKYLVNREEVYKKPIMALFGFDKIKNESTGEEEEIFDFIYRHTLKRPRDIVRIGLELVKIDTKERTPQNVRDTINRVATQIAEDYIKIFVPHTCFNSESEVINLFKLIPHNILTLNNLENICCKSNGESINNKKECKNCNKKHFFCDLYKLGLLGVLGLILMPINTNKNS